MEMIQKLYEERSMSKLASACQKKLDAGDDAFEVYAYMAYALAAKNSLFRPSMETAAEMFEKAAAKCEDGETVLQELCRNFIKEITRSVQRCEESFASVLLSYDTLEHYRNSMKSFADALLLASETAEQRAGISVLEGEKLAVSCMVKLCAAYTYEQNMGKYTLKKTGNAPDDVREAYNEKYDALTEKICAEDASYVPEEIQRTRVDAEHPQKVAEKSEEKEDSGKKTLIDRLLDFF